MEELSPVTGNKPFVIKFEESWIKKDSIIILPNTKIMVRVLETPRRKCYKLILQVLTLGFYHAPYEYKVAYDTETKVYNKPAKLNI